MRPDGQGTRLDEANIRHAVERSFVTSTIAGATSLTQLETGLGAPDVAITPEIDDAIDAVHQIHQNPAP